MELVLLLVVIVISAAFLRFKYSRKLSNVKQGKPAQDKPAQDKPAQDKPAQDENNPYAAVKLLPGKDACQSAHWVSKKVYLRKDKELEHLPLNSCDRIENCNCSFQHLDDRRQEDRRSDSTVLQNVFNSEEHRSKKKRGRRSTD
jgi:hypothetical protein